MQSENMESEKYVISLNTPFRNVNHINNDTYINSLHYILQ